MAGVVRQEGGAIRNDRVEHLATGLATWQKSHFIPAIADDPGLLRMCRGIVTNAVKNLLARAQTVDVERRGRIRRIAGMYVRVLETRQQHAPRKVNDTRRPAYVGPRTGVIADIGDAPATHGHRRRPATRRIDGVDRTVQEHEIRGLHRGHRRRAGHGRSQNHGSQQHRNHLSRRVNGGEPQP